MRAREAVPRFAVSEYTREERKHMQTPMRFCFADPASPLSVVHRVYSDSSPGASAHAPVLRATRSLRCQDNFSCFNIYPTTENSLQVNKLLWDTARNGCYDAPTGDPLLGAHVLALGLAPELYEFLSTVSLPDMNRAIIDFLVLLHHQLTTDGDVRGLEKLHDDLVPHIWQELQRNIGVHPNGEPTEVNRARTLEHLVQISFMTPWRVDVFAAYLTADDVTTALRISSLSPNHIIPLQSDYGLGKRTLQGVVMHKLYRDWCVYDSVLRNRLQMSHRAVTEAMERAVTSGKSAALFHQAGVTMDLCKDPQSWFSTLPVDVVERHVVPWVIRRGCECIPPRRRRLASLKSLLDLSSRFFEELQANSPDVFDQDVLQDLYDAEVLAIDVDDRGDEDTDGGDEFLTPASEEAAGDAAPRFSILDDAGDVMTTGDEDAFFERHGHGRMDWYCRTKTAKPLTGCPAHERGETRYTVEADRHWPLDRFPWDPTPRHVSHVRPSSPGLNKSRAGEPSATPAPATGTSVTS